MQAFLEAPHAEQSDRLILVCTDRASRGVDTAHCNHIVLFDFPRDPSEYVRRAGRTARGAGGTGTVSVLALGRQVCTLPSLWWLGCEHHQGTMHLMHAHGSAGVVMLKIVWPRQLVQRSKRFIKNMDHRGFSI